MSSNGKSRARLNPSHDERTRAKIRTSHIINRLTSFIDGTVEMQPAQVTAALGLLRKSLPDLTAAEVKSETTVTFVMQGVEEAPTEQQWLEHHAPPSLQ